MKILVDRDLCEANAICVEWAPDVFRMNDENRMVVVSDEPAAELIEQVQKAVKRCPRGALCLVDDRP
jgi:ferredoxin